MLHVGLVCDHKWKVKTLRDEEITSRCLLERRVRINKYKCEEDVQRAVASAFLVSSCDSSREVKEVKIEANRYTRRLLKQWEKTSINMRQIF